MVIAGGVEDKGCLNAILFGPLATQEYYQVLQLPPAKNRRYIYFDRVKGVAYARPEEWLSERDGTYAIPYISKINKPIR